MNHTPHSPPGLPSQRAIRLLATPLPLADESFASWIQRIAGSHQYSMSQLVRITGHRPVRSDWDLSIPGEDYGRIVEMIGFTQPRRDSSDFELAFLGQQIKPARFLLNDAGRPRSRWCVACLTADVVPYLRWQWRLAVVRECWRHQTALSDRCPWCAAPALLHTARLVPHGRGGRAGSLAHCDRCSLPLYGGEALDGRYNRALQQRVRRFLQTALSRLAPTTDEQLAASISGFLAAARLPEAQVLGKVDRTDEATSIMMARARAAQCHEKLGAARANQKRWILNGETFLKPAASACGVGQPYIRWSWRLGHANRLKVARVLLAIRAEKRKGPFQDAER
ncbi:TniQ family protein [Variovorax sp. N23]|uniref:TniQ family protein n=1 Tax=Variovorax sp. N23 TaxID=2980555 RepID=UPI0021C56E49|nr:TniQ family protein [Variovorax sp. N23]MCU4121000.1 TniQ family protein [Variovorax sp. N23]